MKVESRTYLGFMAFFAVIGLLYWFTAYEDAGSILLGAAALLSLLLGGYLFVLSRWIPSRTQDDPRASIADGAGTVGEFPAPTVWPFVFGFGATVLATGTVFGVYVVVAHSSVCPSHGSLPAGAPRRSERHRFHMNTSTPIARMYDPRVEISFSSVNPSFDSYV